MLALKHSVRKQTLNVECDSPETAMRLRTVLPELNRSDLLPAIERVLSELTVAGEQIRIGRLEVDLGLIPLPDLELLAGRRLYSELKDALQRALSSPISHDVRPEAVSQLELLEAWLVSGVLPYWAPAATTFTLNGAFAELAESNPAALASLVRRCGRRQGVLERIVLQLDTAVLRRLLSVLEPEHAVLILAYMADLGTIQSADYIAGPDEARFDQLLWLLVLSYLVREAGSQFNRKMFVASLIQDFAAFCGLDYESVLELLGRGMQQTGIRRTLQSSLPAVIAQLLEDHGLTEFTPRTIAEVRDPAFAGEDPLESGAAAIAAMDVAAIARLIRDHGANAAWLEKLIQTLGERTLIRLLAILEPEHAEAIVAFLCDVREVHRAKPVLTGDATRVDRVLWLLVLTYLSNERGSQFNRKTFFLAILQNLARYAGLDFQIVAETLASGLSKARLRIPLNSSLPGIIAEVLADLKRQHLPRAGRESTLTDGPTSYLPGPFETVETLREYLSHGDVPWMQALRDPAVTPTALLATLPDLPAPLIEAVFQRSSSAEQGIAISMAVSQLTPADLDILLAKLLPALKDQSSLLAASVRTAGANAAVPVDFYARLLTAVLQREPLDLEAFSGPYPTATPSRATQRDRNAVKFELTKVLTSPDAAAPHHALGELVSLLLRGNATDTRSFLRTLLARPATCELFAGSLNESEYVAVLKTVAGPIGATAGVLMSAVHSLTAADRPPMDPARAIILTQLLLSPSGARPGREHFDRILRLLFPSPMPARVAAFLLKVLPEHENELRSGIEAASLNPPGFGLVTPPLLTVGMLMDFLLDWKGHPGGGEASFLDLEDHLQMAPGTLRGDFARKLSSPDVRAQLIRVLPQTALARLLQFLEPRSGSVAVEAVWIFTSAWQEAVPGSSQAEVREMLWDAGLGFAASRANSVKSFVDIVLTRFSRRPGSGTPESRRQAETRILLEKAGSLAREAGVLALRDTLEHDLPQESLPRAPSSPGADRIATSPVSPPVRRASQIPYLVRTPKAADPLPPGKSIYIANAGLVLAAPFFPHLFDSLGMTARGENGRSSWSGPEMPSRAVHLLQYLVDESTSTPEPLLILNKVLCGLQPSTPVERRIELASAEREMCHGLMNAVLQNWSIITGTSPDALRETFLQRQGKLQNDGGKWKLHVQRKTVDVLVDQIPWTFKLIFHDWMPEGVHVTW